MIEYKNIGDEEIRINPYSIDYIIKY